MNISSGSVLIMEGASLQYDLLVPMNISSADATTGVLAGTTEAQASEDPTTVGAE
jgi:hypothetical protein